MDAQNLIGELFQLSQSDIRVFLLAGKYHLYKNEFIRSKEAYLTVLRSNKSNIEALHAVGYIFYIQHDFKKSIFF